MNKYIIKIGCRINRVNYDLRALRNSNGSVYWFDTPEDAWFGASLGFFDRYTRKEFPVGSIFCGLDARGHTVTLKIEQVR